MYSKLGWDHINNPRNMGVIKNPDLVGSVGQKGSGAFFSIYIVICDEVVKEAKFDSNGCAASILCGSYITEKIVGQPIESYKLWTVNRLIVEIGGIPPGKQHTPVLAISALYSAFNTPA